MRSRVRSARTLSSAALVAMTFVGSPRCVAANDDGWFAIRPAIVDLAAGKAPVRVNGFVLKPPAFDTADPAFGDAFVHWAGEYGYSAGSPGVAERYRALLAGAERDLRDDGLPVGSLGSAIYYDIVTSSTVLQGRSALSPSQRETLRGMVVLVTIGLERNDNDLATSSGRGVRYRELLADARSLVDPPPGETTVAVRDEAKHQLILLGIDANTVTPATLFCDAKDERRVRRLPPTPFPFFSDSHGATRPDARKVIARPRA